MEGCDSLPSKYVSEGDGASREPVHLTRERIYRKDGVFYRVVDYEKKVVICLM